MAFSFRARFELMASEHSVWMDRRIRHRGLGLDGFVLVSTRNSSDDFFISGELGHFARNLA
jgi:hypothetical protein